MKIISLPQFSSIPELIEQLHAELIGLLALLGNQLALNLFYDSILKWQSQLRLLERILYKWDQVSVCLRCEFHCFTRKFFVLVLECFMCSRAQVLRDWRSLEKVFHFYVYKYVLSVWDYETLEHFRIIDKQTAAADARHFQEFEHSAVLPAKECAICACVDCCNWQLQTLVLTGLVAWRGSVQYCTMKSMQMLQTRRH